MHMIKWDHMIRGKNDALEMRFEDVCLCDYMHIYRIMQIELLQFHQFGFDCGPSCIHYYNVVLGLFVFISCCVSRFSDAKLVEL